MHRQVVEGADEVQDRQKLEQAAHVNLGLPVGVGAGVQAQRRVTLTGPPTGVVARAIGSQRREGAVTEFGGSARLLHVG